MAKKTSWSSWNKPLVCRRAVNALNFMGFRCRRRRRRDANASRAARCRWTRCIAALAVDTSQSFVSYALLFQSPTIMHRLFVAMTTLAALAVVLHPSPCVSAATNVNIGPVTWFLGSGTSSGSTNGRGHAPRFNDPRRCAFTNNGSLLIVDRGNNKIRRVVQPRDDLVETGWETGQTQMSTASVQPPATRNRKTSR
jgi:hypothetical protein